MTWLSVAEIARIQHWTPSEIYWYARRDKWRRTPTRPRGYHRDDVSATSLKELAGRAEAPLPPHRSAVPAGQPVVYYMRIGNRIKIGRSTNLPERLVTINPEELMAVETGDHRVENMRHRQFAALRTHGEWFRYEGALVDHITAIRRTIQC